MTIDASAPSRAPVHASAHHQRIDAEPWPQRLARWLFDRIPEPAALDGEGTAIEAILRAVAGHYGLTRAHLLGDRRDPAIAASRGMALMLCRKHTGATYAQLARVFGRSSPTIHASTERTRGLVKAGGRARDDFEAIERGLFEALSLLTTMALDTTTDTTTDPEETTI